MMHANLYLATSTGLVIAERNRDDWHVFHRALEAQAATCVTTPTGVILVGTRQGMLRSEDAGHSWDEVNWGLTLRHVRWMAAHPEQPDVLFAGTEPAAIFISDDGAQSWRECAEVSQLRDQLEERFAFLGPVKDKRRGLEDRTFDRAFG